MTLTSWFDKNRQVILWLGLVLAVALLERLALALVYHPVAYNDTSSYRSLANAILSGWQGYDGTRTPGYPLFLALMGPDRSVYLAQLVLGGCVTLAFFVLGWQGTGRPAIGGLMALAHTLDPGQIFFEANLLTETLATFWLMAGLLGAWIWLAYPARRSLWLAGEIGVTASLAALTRPLYIFMPVWLALFLVVATPGSRLRAGVKLLGGVLIPAALIIGAWVGYIDRTYHMFSLSVMTGFHLVQNTGYYFEYVPDKYAALRDTFIRYRDARIAERGTAGNTIWTAIPEMQRVSGLSFYDLSRTLTRISVDLILHHPDLYLQRVAQGWWYFWRAPVYWEPEQFPSPVMRNLLEWVVKLERLGLIAANLIFLATSVLALFWRRLQRLWNLKPFLWLVAATLWLTSVVQALLDHGDNPRFLVPMQSLVVFWAFWVLHYSIQALSQRKRVARALHLHKDEAARQGA